MDQFNRLVLVSTPWPLYNRPSIQLGSLKAYIRSQFQDIGVSAHHFYLKIAESVGYSLYEALSERTWLAESVYAGLLFPEKESSAEELFYREAKKVPRARKIDFKDLTTRVRAASDQFIDNIDWDSFGLAGFSICLCQLTSSLYFIRQIKEKHPGLPIVIGGSMFAGDSVIDLMAAFSEIDYAVNGEGELPFARLIGFLKDGYSPDEIPAADGLVTRRTLNDSASLEFDQIQDLSDLPAPDYDDYFNLLNTFVFEKRFFPSLCTEISRGCWWNRPHAGNKISGCAFCNLNLQWKGYRAKNPGHVINEVDALTTRYKTFNVAFMDNALPVKSSNEIFRGLSGLGKDFSIFGEIRATMNFKVLHSMSAAGLNEVQIGIEALSTSLLKKLNKGTTAIQNLEIMKHCEELGIANISNLILHFPGSDEQDVKETLRSLNYAMMFRPLRVVHFWLGMGSPVWNDPGAYGIRARFNHSYFARLFPSSTARSIRFMIQDYHGDKAVQKRLWQPVKQKVRAWKKAYEELHAAVNPGPILSYRDGPDFLIIRQRIPGKEAVTHRLTGTSRKIYLLCRYHQPLKAILNKFPKFNQEKLVPFLSMMVDKKLMFEENGQYLSLAVRMRYMRGSRG